MWTRSELKQRAKVSFKRYYWSAVAVCFIILVLQYLTGNGGTAPTATYRINGNAVYEQDAAVSQTQDYVERYVLSESGMGMLSNFLSTLAFATLSTRLLPLSQHDKKLLSKSFLLIRPNLLLNFLKYLKVNLLD